MLDLTDDERRAFMLGFAANLAAFLVVALVIGIVKAQRAS